MRNYLFLGVVVCIFFTLNGCQKQVNGGDEIQPPQSETKLYRIQQGITNDPNIDTIWNVQYSPDGKIKSVTDSVYEDSIVATYDTPGKIIQVKGTYGDKASFSYNAAGQLIEVSMLWAGSKEKYVFTYDNGVISRRSYLTDAIRSGELLVWRDYVYTVQNGNITSIKVYDKNGSFIGTETRSYGNQSNSLKELSFFNYAGQMGTSELIDWETYFCKNLVTGVSSQVAGYDSYSLTTAYTLSSQHQVSKAVMNTSFGNTYTWQFFYR